MRHFFTGLFLLAATTAQAQTPKLAAQFQGEVQPFLNRYCMGCHTGARASGGLDLKSYVSLEQVAGDFERWSEAANRVAAREMPPRNVAQPPAEQAKQFMDWVHAMRADQLRKGAGDPGVVLARRLSNAEYDATIRDLTGQDLKPTKQFPLDPANTAGFDNSGETLTMSAALMNKYLQSARSIADNLVFTPAGLEFAPHPMRVDTDREKYAIQQIMNFYSAQPTDIAQYFEAAWRYRHRAALGKPQATLASIAAEMKLSAKYLPLVWGILQDKDAVGPVAKLQGMWNALPAPSNPSGVATQTLAMRDYVQNIRTLTAMHFASPRVRGLPGQAQPLHDWRLKLYSQNHRNFDPAALRADNTPLTEPERVPRMPGLHADATPRYALLMRNARRAADAELVYPVAQKAQYEAAFARLASVFPDNFVVSERGRFWPDNSEDQGRFLSAGYHNTAGYFRDDTALMELILDEKGQQKLDQLWESFDFSADWTAGTWTQYFLNNAGQVDGLGAESGLPRPLKNAITDTAVIMDLRDRHMAAVIADPRNDTVQAQQAIGWHFAAKDATMRRIEKLRISAQPTHLVALENFAERAWRRPLVAAERARLKAAYQTLRSKNQLSHEDAVRDTLVGVLMSPDFLYRFDHTGGQAVKLADATIAAAPLTNISLASRLSYFLWSSMPDESLMQRARAGQLGNAATLNAEIRRLLKDERANGLATEFTANWLGVRHFETSNSVDRERFPGFTDDLRSAMFQEPVRFMRDVIANDRSVLDLLHGDYTFVNPVLAKHYGMPAVPGGNDNWVRVDNAARFQRGGLLPMAVFMTQNSPGLRTSPVKRGFWVVNKVLGIRIPPPPPTVPELPDDESKMNLPVREMLAAHRANPVCAACHARFDSFGLAFEGFGPVGEARKADLAGRAVETAVTFPGDVKGEGVSGLKSFIKDHREENFVDNFSRKLLAFALGRSLQLSDEGLIDRMKDNLKANDYCFSAAALTIVQSPQFRTRRVTLATGATRTPVSTPTPLQKINFQNSRKEKP